MTRCRRIAVCAAVTIAAPLFLVGADSSSATGEPPALSVTVDRTSISSTLGRTFSFSSTITNRGSTAASGLIAHLNVLSLRDGVYVDPEDWSSHRTRYLAPIPAGGVTTISWKMQAVNSGSFGVYVALLPRAGSTRPPTTGPAIHVAVAKRRTLNSAGIVPLALGLPALLGGVWLVLRLRRSRFGAPHKSHTTRA